MPKKVLIVEDDPDNRSLVMKCLSKGDYEIYEARHGIEALEKVEELTPDLVILDIVLPGISGYEVCEKIRQSEKSSDVPVIVITSQHGVEIKRQSMEAGANEFVTKPFSIGKISKVIRKVLDEKSEKPS